MLRSSLILAGLLTSLSVAAAQPADKVKLLRTPHGGIQPQAALDAQGVLHLIYFKGTPGHGDVYYVRSKDSGSTFSAPVRVNSHPDSVIATGNVRGAHLAVGKNGRVHVAWMGSSKAEPRAPGKAAPMLYTRLNDDGTAFEAQRNLITSAVGLDGGGSVAADSAGNVYVAWHADLPGKQGEEHRTIWVAHSKDEGKTFAKESANFTDSTGACGCCGMRAFCDSKGQLLVLFRAAKQLQDRDTYLLTSTNQGKDMRGINLHPWTTDRCPMSTFAFAEGKSGVFSAWETRGQVYFSRKDGETGKLTPPRSAPGDSKVRKHPALAASAKGDLLLVWTEGMGWNKGGSLAWQMYDSTGQPTEASGQAAGVPVWSLVSAVALPDGNFRIVY